MADPQPSIIHIIEEPQTHCEIVEVDLGAQNTSIIDVIEIDDTDGQYSVMDLKQIRDGPMKYATKIDSSHVECKICFRRLKASSLKPHLNSHAFSKGFPCDVCGKTFTRSSDTQRHKRKAHNGQTFQCKLCPEKEFCDRNSLKIHLQQHYNSSLFECPICSFKFTKKNYYDDHIQYAHSNKTSTDETTGSSLEPTIKNEADILVKIQRSANENTIAMNAATEAVKLSQNALKSIKKTIGSNLASNKPNVPPTAIKTLHVQISMTVDGKKHNYVIDLPNDIVINPSSEEGRHTINKMINYVADGQRNCDDIKVSLKQSFN